MAQQNMYDGFENDWEEEQRRQQEQAAAPVTSTSPSSVSTPSYTGYKTPQGDDVPAEWAADFLQRNPGDTHRIGEAYASDVKPKGQESVTAQWNSQPSQPASWYAPWFEEFRNEQAARDAETKMRGDELYGKLLERINKAEGVNRDDPIIRNQTSAFNATQTREMRKYLSRLAEQEGPYANLRGEQRMAAGKVAQNSATFEAQLLADELKTQRERIDQALSGALGYVSAEQARRLQEEAMILDQMAAEAGINLQGRSLDLQWQNALLDNDLGLRRLGLEEWDRSKYYDLLESGALD